MKSVPYLVALIAAVAIAYCLHHFFGWSILLSVVMAIVAVVIGVLLYGSWLLKDDHDYKGPKSK